ncbi:MAG: xanthine dehydrogenase family protein molybdopterin-binding subunit [Pseudomonadales bacterium]|nr:xanthine dehydrogenase family protein molybdopterin-binding subunit [Pseudomonadales bacterium]
MTINADISRRSFLKVTALAGSGALFSFSLPALTEELGTLVGSGELNVYVRIASDGKITIYAPHPEMGQGVKTALPMIIAEEMGAKWEDVVVEQSDIDATRYGRQGAGGSTTIPRNFDLMRTVGASAREMLIGAASESMELPRDELKAEHSEVRHPSGKALSFGQLAALAVRQPVPDPSLLKFKDPEDYTILGTSVSGVDNLVITTGLAMFGIDTQVENMRYASYLKCPAIGGKAVSANLEDIKKLPGITDAFIIEGNGEINELMSGVAIVGTNTWAVFNARKHLRVTWDESSASKDNWDELVAKASEISTTSGQTQVVSKGDINSAFSDEQNQVLEAWYGYPFVAHLCLEPMNCTASFIAADAAEESTIEVWAPTQGPYRIPGVLAKLYNLPEDRIRVNQTRLGGGFGRRGSTEFVCEAVEISRRAGTPVKLTWTREDDMAHDYFRAGGFQKVRAALTPDGKLAAWDQHYIGVTRNGRPVSGSRFSGKEFPLLNLDNVRGMMTNMDIGTPCGPWRAPGSNTHAFVVQSFIHELAVAAGRDHLEFLLELMGEPRWFEPGNVRSLNTGRAAGVIRLAAERAGWGKAMPPGRGLGLAFYFSHAGHIAEVAEVSVTTDRQLTLHKVTVAVDIGPIINMSGATSQVQGSVIDGYSTMVGQKITMKQGRIQETNLDEYPVLRIAHAPEVDVHFIQSDNPPTGIGEPALPPLAPAVGNAIFAASGIRVRNMPLIDEGFRLKS